MKNRARILVDILLALVVIAATVSGMVTAMLLTSEMRVIPLVLMPVVVVGSAFALHGEWRSKSEAAGTPRTSR
jgi:hypothetical protein